MRRFSDALRHDSPTRVQSFDRFERLVTEWEARFRRFEALAHGEEVLFKTTMEQTASGIVALQSTHQAARIVNLANAFVLLLNGRNSHAAPPVARALMETCCVPVYTRRNVANLILKGRVAEVHKRLYRIGLGMHESSNLSAMKAIDIKSYIKALATEAEDGMTGLGEELRPEDLGPGMEKIDNWIDLIRWLYSILSEFTHPNSEAMKFSSYADADDFTRWELQRPIDDKILLYALGPSWLSMQIAGFAIDALVETATAHRLVLPNTTPEFAPEEINRVRRLTGANVTPDE